MASYPNRIRTRRFPLTEAPPPKEGLRWEHSLPHPKGCSLSPEILKAGEGPYWVSISGLNNMR